MTMEYRTRGTCSRSIRLSIEDGIITDVSFVGGCSGNLQGICKLVIGKKADEVARTLRGIDCGGKGTSCPDQLARAIEEAAARV